MCCFFKSKTGQAVQVTCLMASSTCVGPQVRPGGHLLDLWSTQSTKRKELPVVSYKPPFPAEATPPSSLFWHAARPTTRAYKYPQILMQQHPCGQQPAKQKGWH